MKDETGVGRVGAAIGIDTVGIGWRVFFWAACGFNFIIGLLGMLSPQSTVDGRIVGLFVLTFGIIYLLVAREPKRFAPTLWAGLIGKVGVVALLGPLAIAPDGDPLVAGILAFDGVFALGFLAFLLTHGDDR